MLVDLVDRGIIRILDLVLLRKELDGSLSGVAIADLDADGELDLAVFEGRGRRRPGEPEAGPTQGTWAS